MLPELLLFFLLDMLSEEYWRSVVRSRELIRELGSVRSMHLRITRDSSGNPKFQDDDDSNDGDDDDDSDDDEDEMSSEECWRRIKQLIRYIHEFDVSIEEFFGFRENSDRPEIDQGILFEHFLLLLLKYLELLKKEEDEEEEEEEYLFNLSEGDETEFEKRKHMAQVILGLLKLAASDKFQSNPRILPILHNLIDTFMRQFPDAMCLISLGGFRQTGIESLSLVEVNNPPGTMYFLLNTKSFHDEQMLQSLGSLANFPLSSYFTCLKLTQTFDFLLRKYCAPRYTEIEMKAVILNVCAFLIQTLPAEEAFKAINQILTTLGKEKNDIVIIFLESIVQNESQQLMCVLSKPDLPLDVQQLGEKLTKILSSDEFKRQYKQITILLSELCDRIFLKTNLSQLSDSSSLARLVFEALFNSSTLPRKPGQKLESVVAAVFDEEVKAKISAAHNAEGAYMRFKRECDLQFIRNHQAKQRIEEIDSMLESLILLCFKSNQNPTCAEALAEIKGKATPTEFERAFFALSEYPQAKTLREIKKENAAALAALQKEIDAIPCRLRLRKEECMELRNEATKNIFRRLLTPLFVSQ